MTKLGENAAWDSLLFITGVSLFEVIFVFWENVLSHNTQIFWNVPVYLLIKAICNLCYTVYRQIMISLHSTHIKSLGFSIWLRFSLALLTIFFEILFGMERSVLKG